MKIAFIWYWKRASEIMPNWRDGLRAAIEIISKKHEVVWFLDEKVPDPSEKWDFILFWGDSNCPFFYQLHQYNCRKGICLSTSPHNPINLANLDVVFCESDLVYEDVRKYGIRAIKAFGTDTDFYQPLEQDKTFEYFYPATFSPWKKQSDIAHFGIHLVCVGTIQPDGVEELDACNKMGVITQIGYFPADIIKNYYDKAKNVPIPAIHGSERTVLEAMSMNILPNVSNPINQKARSYIEEYRQSKMDSPREFILQNYSHYKYAENLLKGIEE